MVIMAVAIMMTIAKAKAMNEPSSDALLDLSAATVTGTAMPPTGGVQPHVAQALAITKAAKARTRLPIKRIFFMILLSLLNVYRETPLYYVYSLLWNMLLCNPYKESFSLHTTCETCALSALSRLGYEASYYIAHACFREGKQINYFLQNKIGQQR
jgi:hypothetical protein